MCWQDYENGEVYEIDSAFCAKRFLDDICETYGKQRPIDSEKAKHFNPPVVKVLAHNLTYDISFLWEHLQIVQTIKKGSSIVCGSAMYVRYGRQRVNDPRCKDDVLEKKIQMRKLNGKALVVAVV